MSEVWKPVVGFEGVYEVSNMGRVRSLDRLTTQRAKGGGTCERYRKGVLLRPGKATAGHLTVALGRGNSRLVHHLVLEAFVGPKPPGLECRHLNGVENDNRLENLRWDTRGNNSRDKKWHRGAATYKLSPSDINVIKTELAKGVVGRRLAERFGVSESNVSCIKRGVIHCDVIGN